jgi:hypothetical protein
MGRTARLGHADGTCSSSSKLLGPFHAERGGGLGKGAADAAGVRVRGGARRTGAGRGRRGQTCVCSSDTTLQQAWANGLGQHHARGVRTRSSTPNVQAIIRPCLFRERKHFRCYIGCFMGCRKGFSDTNYSLRSILSGAHAYQDSNFKNFDQ